MPLISVIVPVYNVENYLSRCVESILSQTFTNFELILVDDGSPDNCGSICDAYAAEDDRIVVIHQENNGLSAARNAGIDWVFANSDSQWITFIDSDDWVHPQYLSSLLESVTTHNVDVGICHFYRTNGEIPQINQQDFISKLHDTETFYIKNNTVATIACGKLYKKSCFISLRYPIGKIHEDEFITYRILFKSEQIAVIAAPLYMYYQNPSSITYSEWTPKRLDVLTALEERINFFDNLNNERMSQYAKLQLDSRLAWLNLQAYKYKKHNLLPQKYKLHFLSAVNTLESVYGTEKYESIMWNLYPSYVKLEALFRKLLSVILKRNMKKECKL